MFLSVSPMQTLTIQQVAQQTGLTVHTLRYYERNGLLEPVDRASSGHRRYSAQDIARIEFLTRLRATGMPIRQMQEFARLFRERPEAIGSRRKLLEAHEQQVQAHIQELRSNLEMIQWKIGYYKDWKPVTRRMQPIPIQKQTNARNVWRQDELLCWNALSNR